MITSVSSPFGNSPGQSLSSSDGVKVASQWDGLRCARSDVLQACRHQSWNDSVIYITCIECIGDHDRNRRQERQNDRLFLLLLVLESSCAAAAGCDIVPSGNSGVSSSDTLRATTRAPFTSASAASVSYSEGSSLASPSTYAIDSGNADSARSRP